MTRIRSALRRLRRGEDGSSTIEFMIVLPILLSFFFSTFELGMMLTRQVMLDRGMDIAMRQVRLGALTQVNQDNLRRIICDAALIIPDCLNRMKIEMMPVDPRNWRTLRPDPDCVSRDNPVTAQRDFQPGQPNELMVVRACAVLRPYFPGSGLGFALVGQSGNAFGLTSTSAFVIEPS
ncbi:TadE-like protein [Rubellimicrobium thermophilum DSM 16684]|uniref:TadE-like protein n=1 Tax=Rubellimicrobium thermophilum DSM 16684 TaxID=1123069 RepID=S9SJJ5_9RHOB|nr:TadE family protein [Rubellimicrobium thermophilum]EPX86514.1 TadE-like protein [Rubellimicrobium thermophilum DSM 16684]